MKIVTWNMDCWKRDVSRHDEAWAYLVEELRPDIALLQEVRPPASFEGNNLLYTAIGGSRRWGSAIFTNGLPIHGIPIENHKGWVVAGEILLPNNSKAVAVSIHARFIEREVFPHLNYLFDDLSPVLEEQTFIVGGDLNAARLIDEVYGTRCDSEFFDRIESSGFFNCHRKFHAKEQQTFWGKTKYPYQDDHLFVSEHLKEQVLSCDTLDYERIRKLSDHSPVLAEIGT